MLIVSTCAEPYNELQEQYTSCFNGTRIPNSSIGVIAMNEATHMKAIRIHQFGGLEELKYEDAPIPVPAADEILIKVAGTAFNQADVKIRKGYLQAFSRMNFLTFLTLRCRVRWKQQAQRLRTFSRGTRSMLRSICPGTVLPQNMWSPKRIMLRSLQPPGVIRCSCAADWCLNRMAGVIRSW